MSARYGPPRTASGDDARFVVLGMGKLGGEELNFASDVDVIYVYSSDQGEAGSISLHEYFAKLCTAVTGAMSEVTEDDVVFRVDLRLRPEGSTGAIASSLEAMERYYETFGRPWERQAWIKARVSAGDQALGAEVLAMLRPFVFPRLVAPTVIDDVRDLAFAQLAQDRRGRTLPLARVLEEVLTEIDPLAKEKGVAIEVREPVPEVKVDATRVTIILLNLVGNAAKYADMTKPTRWVSVDFEPVNGSRAWWVVVSDNGLGIPPEVHARIFERFFRAHPEAAEGTGLGLPIVKEAIRQLESEIEFESAPGRGTTFRFLLTVPPDEPADA
jgi:two-component sensor histidine kinase